MPEISVIIVTYNNEDEIESCVGSIPEFVNGSENELVIIDNNSQDKTYEILKALRFPYLKIIKNESNLGYTKAVNQGIRYSSGNFIFLLNPDTILNDKTIDSLHSFLCENDDYAAAAPVIFYPNGKIQYSVRNFPSYWAMFCEFMLLAYLFPKSPTFNSWKAKYIDYSKSQDVEQPMAAALMVKRDWINKYGAMDERFEMFFNDVDLCKRIYDTGFRIRLIADAGLTHLHGASVRRERIRMIKIWSRDCIEYFTKHKPSAINLIWLKLFLKISGFFRITYYRIKKV